MVYQIFPYKSTLSPQFSDYYSEIPSYQSIMPSKWAALRQKLTWKTLVLVLGFLSIVVVGAILFMCLVGMLQFDDISTKNMWIEVTSQILNGLFTLNALILHPGRVLFLIRIWKLKQELDKSPSGAVLSMDNVALSRVLKHAPYSIESIRPISPLDTLDRPNITSITELKIDSVTILRQRLRYLMFLVLLMNLNCLAQYPITICMWAFRPDTRPNVIVYTFIPISFLSGAIGGWLMNRFKGQVRNGEQ